MGIVFKTESRAYHSGQHDLTLLAIHDGTTIGYIEYALYQNNVYIQMVKVSTDFRRQGIGSLLVKQLQKEYPNTEIEVGYSTEDGSKLFKSMKTITIPNEELEKKSEHLKNLNKQISDIEALFDENHIPDDEQLNYIEQLNKYYDEVRVLEKELDGQKLSKSYFDTN